MIIGIPKEIKKFESRVAITPDSVKKLSQLGHEICIESEAGEQSSFNDQTYINAGGKIAETFSSITNPSSKKFIKTLETLINS